MMICSIPAATASSTPYWMIGLSTSGSISLGCAFVAGRNRVPQPAAGNTAFRTRIEPQSGVGPQLVGPIWRIAPAPFVAPRRGRHGLGRERPDELLDEAGEGLRAIDVREVSGARDHAVRDARHAGEEALGADPEDEVHRPVDDEDLAAVGEQPVPEPAAGEVPHGLRAALREVAPGGDGGTHHGPVSAAEPGERDGTDRRLGREPEPPAIDEEGQAA